jgi:hypothetical protein
MTWPMDIMSVSEVNDKRRTLGHDSEYEIVQGLWSSSPAKGVVNPVRFNDLTENEKDELFKNSIQAYVQYLKELKQKGKNVAMKIISHAWRSYKSKLVNIWRNQDTPFRKYKGVTKEDWARFIEKCKSVHFVVESQYMQ